MTAYKKPRLLEPTMTKLLPCPFCGMTPVVTSYDYKTPKGTVLHRQWRVECEYHGCEVQPTADWHYMSREEAIAAWNRRADA